MREEWRGEERREEWRGEKSGEEKSGEKSGEEKSGKEKSGEEKRGEKRRGKKRRGEKRRGERFMVRGDELSVDDNNTRIGTKTSSRFLDLSVFRETCTTKSQVQALGMREVRQHGTHINVMV